MTFRRAVRIGWLAFAAATSLWLEQTKRERRWNRDARRDSRHAKRVAA